MLITQVGKVKIADTSAASRLRSATTADSGRRASERVTGEREQRCYAEEQSTAPGRAAAATAAAASGRLRRKRSLE